MINLHSILKSRDITFLTKVHIVKAIIIPVFMYRCESFQFSSVAQLCLFETPWTAACHASLSIINSRSLPKLTSIESVMPSNHLILCRSLLLPSIFPSIRSFQMSQHFASGGQSIGVSASASVFPMNTQD